MLDSHIETIFKKVAAGIAAIKRVKPFVPPEMLKVIYNALVHISIIVALFGTTVG